jgi:hypothetical protein
MNSPLFWFTLVVPAAIVGLGINFIFNPVGASTGFGIPIHDPAIYMHWGTGLYMAIVAAFLLRNKST